MYNIKLATNFYNIVHKIIYMNSNIYNNTGCGFVVLFLFFFFFHLCFKELKILVFSLPKLLWDWCGKDEAMVNTHSCDQGTLSNLLMLPILLQTILCRF